MGIIMQIQTRLMRGVMVPPACFWIAAGINTDGLAPCPEFRGRIRPVMAGRHVSRQQFEHHGARLFDPLAGTVDDHAFGRLADTGRRKRTLALHLADASAAIAIGAIAGLIEMAQMRDHCAFAFGDIPNGFINRSRHLAAIKNKLDRFCHDTVSSRKNRSTERTGLLAACPKPQIEASRIT